MKSPLRHSVTALLLLGGVVACDQAPKSGGATPAPAAPAAILQPAEGYNPDAVGDDIYQPSVGQDGKDVIWVPTPIALVDKMLSMADVKPTDVVVDLGAGDGKLAIAAGKLGAKARGVELNADLVGLAQRNAVRAGVADKVSFVQGDIFEEKWSDATVVTLYLLPDLNLRLRPRLLQMTPGTRVVSNSFTMGEWAPDSTAKVGDKTAYFWIVPASIGGEWTFSSPNVFAGGSKLRFGQSFQRLNADFLEGNEPREVRGAALGGRNLTLNVRDRNGLNWKLTGQVNGTRMSGTILAADGRMENFSATHSGPLASLEPTPPAQAAPGVPKQ
jgi:SAM-dependent methyltransferase